MEYESFNHWLMSYARKADSPDFQAQFESLAYLKGDFWDGLQGIVEQDIKDRKLPLRQRRVRMDGDHARSIEPIMCDFETYEDLEAHDVIEYGL